MQALNKNPMYSVPCEFIYRGINPADRVRLCKQARGVQGDLEALQTRLKRELYAKVQAATANKGALEARLAALEKAAQSQRATSGAVAPKTAAELAAVRAEGALQGDRLAAANSELEAYRQLPQYLQGLNARIDAMTAAVAALGQPTPQAAPPQGPIQPPMPPRPSLGTPPSPNVGVAPKRQSVLQPPTSRVDFMAQLWDFLYPQLAGKDLTRAIMTDKDVLEDISDLVERYDLYLPDAVKEQLDQWLNKVDEGRHNPSPQEITELYERLRRMLTPQEDAQLRRHMDGKVQSGGAPFGGNVGVSPAAQQPSDVTNLAIELHKRLSPLLPITEEKKYQTINDRGNLEELLQRYPLQDDSFLFMKRAEMLDNDSLRVRHVGDFLDAILSTMDPAQRQRYDRGIAQFSTPSVSVQDNALPKLAMDLYDELSGALTGKQPNEFANLMLDDNTVLRDMFIKYESGVPEGAVKEAMRKTLAEKPLSAARLGEFWRYLVESLPGPEKARVMQHVSQRGGSAPQTAPKQNGSAWQCAALKDAQQTECIKGKIREYLTGTSGMDVGDIRLLVKLGTMTNPSFQNMIAANNLWGIVNDVLNGMGQLNTNLETIAAAVAAPPPPPSTEPSESLQAVLDFQQALDVMDKFSDKRGQKTELQVFKENPVEFRSNPFLNLDAIFGEGRADTILTGLDTPANRTLASGMVSIIRERLMDDKKVMFTKHIPFVLQYTQGFEAVVADILRRAYVFSFPIYQGSGQDTEESLQIMKDAFLSQPQQYNQADGGYLTTTNENVGVSGGVPPRQSLEGDKEDVLDLMGGMTL